MLRIEESKQQRIATTLETSSQLHE